MVASEKEYKEIFDKFVSYEQSVHLANQKRIRVGLKVNIGLPLIFLILSFAIKEAKLIFLILWIITLFGIAGYLIYVEYSDYEMMHRLEEFGVIDQGEKSEAKLIGETIQIAEATINEKLDMVDERIEEGKEKLAKELEEKKDQLKEMAIQKLEKQEEKDNEEHH